MLDEGSVVRYRQAGAQARARLVAADIWQVQAREIEIERGVLSRASGKRATSTITRLDSSSR
jgi:hypothetical protein